MAKKHKKTIIITTHYIEEANKSDCVSQYTYNIVIYYYKYLSSND
jgi:hypothetical protein